LSDEDRPPGEITVTTKDGFLSHVYRLSSAPLLRVEWAAPTGATTSSSKSYLERVVSEQVIDEEVQALSPESVEKALAAIEIWSTGRARCDAKLALLSRIDELEPATDLQALATKIWPQGLPLQTTVFMHTHHKAQEPGTLMLSEALEIAGDGARAHALVDIAPVLGGNNRSRAIEALVTAVTGVIETAEKQINEGFFDEYDFDFDEASRWLRVLTPDLSVPLWQRILAIAGALGRRHLLEALPTLTPIAAALGHDEFQRETINALFEISEWWP